MSETLLILNIIIKIHQHMEHKHYKLTTSTLWRKVSLAHKKKSRESILSCVRGNTLEERRQRVYKSTPYKNVCWANGWLHRNGGSTTLGHINPVHLHPHFGIRNHVGWQDNNKQNRFLRPEHIARLSFRT